MELPTKPNKDNNQSYDEIDMEVFEWKENTKTVFVRSRNIEEVNKKLYLLFNDQCKTSLITNLKGTKGYDKAHREKYGIKLLELIRNVSCGVESYLQVIWAMMKADKRLYLLF